jgi:predicted aldo/keto reductase-like oxidoreductase
MGFGSGATSSAKLVRYALDHGITYFDTAESYPLGFPGVAERAIARGIAGRRNEVVIGTKTEARADESRDVFMRRLEASLRRLRTDRIDIYFNHAVNDLARLENPEWHEFTSRAKRQGKIRYVGMSGHGGHLLECLERAIDHELVDVFLGAHNFGADPKFYEHFTKSFDLVANQKGLPRIIQKAKAKGIGVLVMKTLMGAKLNDMRPYEWGSATYAQAAFRWVFSNPDVNALVVSMKSTEQIDEYLRASGETRPRAGDARRLRGYLAAHGASQCRQGCGSCADACPEGVQITEVLRARMYAEDYGEAEAGRTTYASLATDASACGSCSHKACLEACPYGLNVAERTRTTPKVLGLD